jgi:hypothetical protein
MVKRLGTKSGRLDKDAQVIHHLVLSVEVAEVQRTEGVLEVALLLAELLFSDVKFFSHGFFNIEKQRYTNALTFLLKDADVFIKT